MPEVFRMELPSGTVLNDGRYIIDKKIGAGGFGITYSGHHSTLNKKIAIKEFFLNGYNMRNTSNNHVSLQGMEIDQFNHYRQRFINEAKTLAALNHDAIVKVEDIFDENGTSYMVMDFVEGNTLQQIVETEGPMEYEMAVNYIVLVCEALSYIHSNNILHRDVTPNNIIVTPDNKIVLIDFGSARRFVENKTQQHTILLTKGYAPLEQRNNKLRKGAFTDLYSLGAVFYFLLTGVQPIDAIERTTEQMKEPIELNPNVPVQINAIIMKAMEMNSADRYQTAQELIDDIFSGEFPNNNNDDDKLATTAFSTINENQDFDLVVKKQNTSRMSSKPKKKQTKLIIGMVVVASLIALTFLLLSLFHKEKENTKSDDKALTAMNENPSGTDDDNKNDTITVDNKDFTVKEGNDSVKFHYSGPTVNGLPNGKGEGHYESGTYIGSYVEGVREGNDNNQFLYKNKDCYNGSFKNGMFNKGEYKSHDGFRFKGEFRNNDPYNGTWYDKNNIAYSKIRNGKVIPI